MTTATTPMRIRAKNLDWTAVAVAWAVAVVMVSAILGLAPQLIA